MSSLLESVPTGCLLGMGRGQGGWELATPKVLQILWWLLS
jgi:hypothetical protein